MTRQSTIHSSTVFLISGGARGITARCAIAMAQRYRCTFVLIGRSANQVSEATWVAEQATGIELQHQLIERLSAQGEKPDLRRVRQLGRAIEAAREINATLQAIDAVGGQAYYLQVDVGDRDGVEKTLRPFLQQFEQVAGLVHGAGTLADKLIEHKTLDDYERVYRPKVVGLDNLLACLPQEQLQYLVLFSSVAGFYGNVGQSDYAIANDTLNKAAYRLRQQLPLCRIVAMNWGPWDGGMVTPELKAYFAEQQVHVIPVEVGAQLLLEALEAPVDAPPQTVIGGPLSQPVSTSVTVSPTLNAYRIRRRFAVDTNAFLRDHIIGDRTVVPAVSAIQWMVNACEQRYPGYSFRSCRELKVLKGIVMGDTPNDEYTLDLKEVAKDPAGSIVFEALIWSMGPTGRPRFHYSGLVELVRQLPAPPHYAPLTLTRGQTMAGAELYRDGTLFHGPAFRGIEEVLDVNERRAVLRCRVPVVPAEAHLQFPLRSFNPFQNDIQFQSLLVWARVIYGSASLPVGAQAIERFRILPPDTSFYSSLEVVAHTNQELIADVHVHDEQGLLYARITKAQVTISPQLNELFRMSTVQVV